MKDTKTSKNNKALNLLKVGGISMTRGILAGLYDFCEGMKDVVINPYKSLYGLRPDYYSNYSEKQIKRAVHELKRQNLIKTYKDNEAKGKTLYKLTDEGVAAIKKQLALKGINSKIKNMKWDGKWRIVIFDVPEVERHLRDILRYHLKELGFKMIQLSTWAFPFDVFDELEILIPDIKKHSWIKLMTVEFESKEDDIKKKFNL